MSALHDALKHPVNRPDALTRWLASLVNPSADLRGLEDGGGVVCDFRPGLEEEDPSLSVSVGRNGTVYKRFGGDDFNGGAVAFVASCLGISEQEARAQLIDRAGLVDTPPAKHGEKKAGSVGGRKASTQTQSTTPAKTKARTFDPERVLEKLSRQGPQTPEALAYALNGWARIEASEDSPEALELTRRGLLPAVLSGALVAYKWTGKTSVNKEDPTGPYKSRSLPKGVLLGAIAFELRGPDGQVWGVKIRNPGKEEDLKAARVTRYKYAGKDYNAPAWCSPGYLEDTARPVLMVEGELNAVAVWVILEAAGLAHAYRVQGVGSVEYWPTVSGLSAGVQTFIYADPDKAGVEAREVWGQLCAHVGAEVLQLKKKASGIGVFSSPSPLELEAGEKYTLEDACDFLNPAKRPGILTPEQYLKDRAGVLLEGIKHALPWQPKPTPTGSSDGEEEAGAGGDVWLTKKEGFGVRGGRTCALKIVGEDDEQREQTEELLNFSAYIVAEVKEEDGAGGEASTVFEIEGTRASGQPLPRLRLPSSEFAGMNWPSAKWGAGAIVRSGSSRKDRAREAIQRLSEARGVSRRTVYQHTGWISTEAGPVFLTAGACIGAGGGVDGLEVELTGRLSGFALPDPAKAEAAALREAVRQSLDLLNLADLDAVTVPTFGAVWRAPLGRSDFAVWTTGQTGMNKTVLSGLSMAHFGAAWNREHLPDGWNSTANSLEKSAFAAKDVLFIVDDFKPGGGAGDVAKAQGMVTRLLTSAADGAGRSTLTADRKARAGLYPRGLVMSSSETMPRGHSNRARAVIVPFTRPLIGKDAAKSAGFYEAEDRGKAGVYALAMAAYIQGLAGNLEALRVGSDTHRQHVRQWARVFEGAHGRTGNALAELSYGWACFLAFAVKLEAITEGQALEVWGRVVAALLEVSEGQREHLTTEDPITRALYLTSSLLAQGRVYLADLQSGQAPGPDSDTAALCGWQRRTFYASGEGEDREEVSLKPGAVLVGWHATDKGTEYAYFLPDALYEQLQRATQGQGGAALPDASTLWANMRDTLSPAGLMRCQKDGARLRSTWKVSTPEGQRRQLIALRFPLQTGVYENVGTVGTVGTDGEEKTYSMAFMPVPITLFFNNFVGTVGTEAPSNPSFSPGNNPEALAPADPQTDLEDAGEALEDWGEV